MLIDWGSSGQIPLLRVPNTDTTDYSQPGIDDSGWGKGTFPYGQPVGGLDSHWESGWIPVRTYQSFTEFLWTRLHLPSGTWTVQTRQDDAAWVYLNGTQIHASSGFTTETVQFQGGGVLAVKFTDLYQSVCYSDQRVQGAGDWKVGVIACD